MKKKDPTFTNPKNRLKEKVGDGGIPAHFIKQCQDYLESNPVDFSPFARRFLERLEMIRKDIENNRKDNAEQTLEDIVNIIMQMKSNGSMFHYQLISMTSDVMLRFLENVKKLDEDFLDIFAVYIKVGDIILKKKLTGNGGREGYVLTQELHSACLRYYAKYAIPH
jgi:hypothetical protein